MRSLNDHLHRGTIESSITNLSRWFMIVTIVASLLASILPNKGPKVAAEDGRRF